MSEDVIIRREERLERVKALWPKLTSRQVECLCLRMMGFTLDEVGQVLGIGHSVVSEHLGKIQEATEWRQNEVT